METSVGGIHVPGPQVVKAKIRVEPFARVEVFVIGVACSRNQVAKGVVVVSISNCAVCAGQIAHAALPVVAVEMKAAGVALADEVEAVCRIYPLLVVIFLSTLIEPKNRFVQAMKLSRRDYLLEPYP